MLHDHVFLWLRRTESRSQKHGHVSESQEGLSPYFLLTLLVPLILPMPVSEGLLDPCQIRVRKYRRGQHVKFQAFDQRYTGDWVHQSCSRHWEGGGGQNRCTLVSFLLTWERRREIRRMGRKNYRCRPPQGFMSNRGRVVKASDSKSDSLWERRFESCRLRASFEAFDRLSSRFFVWR